jgi:hypothetical protein
MNRLLFMIVVLSVNLYASLSNPDLRPSPAIRSGIRPDAIEIAAVSRVCFNAAVSSPKRKESAGKTATIPPESLISVHIGRDQYGR